ncbi:MAG: amidohydrolase [Bifidobacteriaceae bacterium]|nr:amidohydrolase [Bifidobacteriaceae bacterium]
MVTGGEAARYVEENSRGQEDRFYILPCVESFFAPDTYRIGRAPERLTEELEHFRPKGFNHYEAPWHNGSWFLSDEGLAYFKVAAEWNQIVSIHVEHHHLPSLRKVAEMFPNTPFLLHHMGFPTNADNGETISTAEVLACAELPNMHVKVFGFDIGSARPWDYPYPKLLKVLADYVPAFGPERLHWGSNFPICASAMTYRQSLEGVREHWPESVDEAAAALIMGEFLMTLLEAAGR